ncbi:unannotated protein [freshwater metagenome]|jgi:hypothetical protein|uniref:Unannotated protein n=1 Tax=freshwater metagenome TaxID=449393 RepID=A0A6J7Q6T8_9ZZZZ|nr:hypothetical protein [Actinomycetota bacterium]
MGHTGRVHAELSSLSSTTATMKARVASLTEGLREEKDAELLSVLYEVERSLGNVNRQLERAVRLAK